MVYFLEHLRPHIYIHQFQDFSHTLELSAQCACNLLGGSGLRAWLCGAVALWLCGRRSWHLVGRSKALRCQKRKKLPPWLLCIGATHCFKPSHGTFTFVTYMTMCGGCLPNWLFYVCSCGSSKNTKKGKKEQKTQCMFMVTKAHLETKLGCGPKVEIRKREMCLKRRRSRRVTQRTGEINQNRHYLFPPPGLPPSTTFIFRLPL